METKNALPINVQTAQSATTPKKGGLFTGAISLILVLIAVWNFMPSFSGHSGNEAEARKAAELRVQSSAYTSTGIIPKTESTVVYKNKNYLCVGVNYTFEDDFKNSAHWTKIVCLHRDSNIIRGISNDWGGVDIYNLTEDELEQVKVLYDLE